MADPTLQFHSHNLPYVEDLYARFLNGDTTVPAEWANYFRNSLNGSGVPAVGTSFDPPFASRSVFNPPGGGARTTSAANSG